MGFHNIVGAALLGAAITPRQLAPLPTITTEIDFPATTSVFDGTFTFNGPFTQGPFEPFDVTLTNFEAIVPTTAPNGVVEDITYTIIGSPIVSAVGPGPTPPPNGPLTHDVYDSIYIGCFDPNTYGPLLSGPSIVVGTQEECKGFCDSNPAGPYRYFSISPISNCQCGQILLYSGIPRGQCTTPCTGNVTQECGGPGGDTSVWESYPIYDPLPNYPDPSAPGDGVDNYWPHVKKPHHPRPKPHKPYKPSPPPKKEYPTYEKYPTKDDKYDTGYPTHD